MCFGVIARLARLTTSVSEVRRFDGSSPGVFTTTDMILSPHVNIWIIKRCVCGGVRALGVWGGESGISGELYR